MIQLNKEAVELDKDIVHINANKAWLENIDNINAMNEMIRLVKFKKEPKTLNDIDELLQKIEDYIHGKDGFYITDARKLLCAIAKPLEIEYCTVEEIKLMKENSIDLTDFKENLPLYKDSGLWQLRSDNMEDVLVQQDYNESVSNFIKRCHQLFKDSKK